MSVGSILGGGIALVRTRPKLIMAWVALYILVALLGMVLVRPLMASVVAFQQAVAINAAAGIRTPPPFPADAFGAIFLLDLGAAIVSVIAFAAVIRAVAWPSNDRFFHLRFGMDELRLVGLGILLLIGAFVIEIVAIVGLVLIGTLAAAILGKAAGLAIGAVLAVILMLGAIYLEVRISLVGAFTVLQRHIVIGPAWRATKGRFWTLFGVYVVLTLAFIVAGLVTLAFTSPRLLAAYIHFDQQAMNAALLDQFARQASDLSITLLLRTIVGSLFFVVIGVIAIASIASAAIAWGAADREV